MAIAVETAMPMASQREVSSWICRNAAEQLAERAAHIERIESEPGSSRPKLTSHPPVIIEPSAQDDGPKSNRSRATKIEGAVAHQQQRIVVTHRRRNVALGFAISFALSLVVWIGTRSSVSTGAVPPTGEQRPAVAVSVSSAAPHASSSAPVVERAAPTSGETDSTAPLRSNTAAAQPPLPPSPKPRRLVPKEELYVRE